MEQDARLLSAMQKMCDQKMPLNTLERKWQIANIPYMGNDSNLLIVFYVQIMPDDLVMQLHRF